MKWVTSRAKLFELPGKPYIVYDAHDKPMSVYIEPRQYVQPTGSPTQAAAYPGLDTPVEWEEVIYESRDFFGAKAYKGWLYSGFLEEVCDEFPPGTVAMPPQTQSFNDPRQYMVWLGKKQFNLCGEFCVAFLAHKSIDDLLTQWQPKAPNFFNRVFNILAHGEEANVSRTTGKDDLRSMLSVYDKDAKDVNELLWDPVKQGLVPTPGRYAAITAKYDLILSVHIKPPTEDVTGEGVGHWICVTKVEPIGRNRGYVTFYNPLPNQMQREAWYNMAVYMGAPFGLAIERTPD